MRNVSQLTFSSSYCVFVTSYLLR